MERFIGKWKNEAGNILKIKANNHKSLKVSFFSSRTGIPIIRKYFEKRKP